MGNVTMLEAIIIAARYAAGLISRAEAERLLFTDEELKMTPEQRRAGSHVKQEPKP